MESKFPDKNSDVADSSRVSVVDHILYFQQMWRDHWAAVSSRAGTDLNIVTATGAVVACHQCVLLPLSPQLCQLLQPALSCESPWNVATLILPDRTQDDVSRLLQLIYTGSCLISNGDMYSGLVRLMHDLGLYIPGERLSFKPVVSKKEEAASEVASKHPLNSEAASKCAVNSEAASKHALNNSSFQVKIIGFPPEGLNSPASSIQSQTNCPGADKLPRFDSGNEAIDLSKKVQECDLQSPQFSLGTVESNGKETSFKSLMSDQFENQNDEVGNFKCAHCGLKFCTNTPVMYGLMHERSCKQQLLQSSEVFTVSGDAQTNVRDCQPDRLPSRDSDSTESTDSNENIFSEGIFHSEENVLESSNNIESVDVEMKNNEVNCCYGNDSKKLDIKDSNENESMIEVLEIEDTNENHMFMAQNLNRNNIEDISTDDTDVNLITEIINLEKSTPKGTGNIKPVDTLKKKDAKPLKNCYICNEELEQLDPSVYHHYSTVHFSEELLRDFGSRVNDDKCLDCGTVVNGLKDQYRFLVHMGVKHKRVEKYLPSKEKVLFVYEDENDGLNENWAQNTTCPVCSFSMEKFKVGEKSDHFYGHFKDNIKDWFAGMRYVYAFPSTTCPQCKKLFKDEHCLYKHLGSAHNLYQTFIQRSKIQVEKKEESIIDLNDVEMEVEKEEEIGCKTECGDLSKNTSKPKVSAKTFYPKTKEPNNGSKYVNRKLSLNAVNKECCLCSKQFSNYHRLRYHYSLVHFRKELEAEMYPLFENNNGSCPLKSCPKVFKRFKFFMYHMGSIHKQVDKYVEMAKSEVAKNPQTSKKNKPYCKAKYKICSKCDKKTRSYNCVKHMVTHYYDEIEKELEPNGKMCFECDKSYENLDDLIHHVAETHKALNRLCSQEELEFIETAEDMEIPPLNFGKIEKDVVTINFKKKTQDIVEKRNEPGDTKVLMDASRKEVTRPNPGYCKICNKQTKNNATLLQHLCGHFRKELKQEFFSVLCRREPQVTCPKCDIVLSKPSFLTHIGAMHKEVVKYAPWLTSKKDQTSLKCKKEKVGEIVNQESQSSGKCLAFLEEKRPDTEVQEKNIPVEDKANSSEGKINQKSFYNDHDDDSTEPPLITVNPSKANVSVTWNDSDIEVLEPPAESSTSSVMASSSPSRLSSPATTSLIPVSPLLGPGDYSESLESAMKAFRDKNKN